MKRQGIALTIKKDRGEKNVAKKESIMNEGVEFMCREMEQIYSEGMDWRNCDRIRAVIVLLRSKLVSRACYKSKYIETDLKLSFLIAVD